MPRDNRVRCTSGWSPDDSFDAVIVVLADQPLIGVAVAELIGAFKKRPSGHGGGPLCAASAAIHSGLDRRGARAGLAGDTNLGCRQFIERQPELVHVYESSNTRFVTDLDTVEDVRELQRTGWRLDLPTAESTSLAT